jgi:ElaB/YqjD/DUF883 family membrane-anchored ribosome-binding protein
MPDYLARPSQAWNIPDQVRLNHHTLAQFQHVAGPNPLEDEMTTPNEAFKRAANSPAGREAAETAKRMGEEVTDFADDLSRKASKQFARAQDMAGDVYDNAHAAVRRDPVTALAIALGIGFLFGVVVASRR